MLVSLILLAVFGLVIWMLFPQWFTPKKSKTPRSVEVGEAQPGEGRPRRQTPYAKELLPYSVAGGDTPSRLFRLSVEKFGGRPSMGWRDVVRVEKEKKVFHKPGQPPVEKVFDMPYCSDYKWRTFTDIGDEVARIGAGLASLELKQGDFTSIFANTRPEWHITAQACFAHGFPIATCYASLGEDAVAFSLDESKVTLVISELAVIDTLIKAAAKTPSVRTVILMDSASDEQLASLSKKASQLTFYSWPQIIERGKSKAGPAREPTPDDLAVIMYTSGSSGNPKGVLITQGNIVAAVAACSLSVPDLSEKDTYIAYLPLAHILEIAAEIAMISKGVAIGYGSAQRLRDDQAYSAETGKPLGDLRALRPTLMASVPLILDRIKAAIEEVIANSSPIVKKLFAIAYKLKKREWKAGRRTSLWDKIVFGKMAARFGGRLRFMLAGGAPLSAGTQEFISIAFSCSVVQGYGLTETSAGGCIGDHDNVNPGRVGPPVPCCEIKLVDVPEMGYSSSDSPPKGEVAIRGYNVTRGYYKLEEKTAESYKKDKDGNVWFYTGDIGMWQPDGNLSIIDRKKDLVKLQHGEYIALGKLEAVYGGSRYVDFVCAYGDSNHSAPVALVVPKPDVLNHWARDNHVPNDDWKALCANPKARAEVLSSLISECKKVKLAPTETPQAVHLVDEPWTPASGLITDALKLKRNVIQKHYASTFEDLYRSKK